MPGEASPLKAAARHPTTPSRSVSSRAPPDHVRRRMQACAPHFPVV